MLVFTLGKQGREAHKTHKKRRFMMITQNYPYSPNHRRVHREVNFARKEKNQTREFGTLDCTTTFSRAHFKICSEVSFLCNLSPRWTSASTIAAVLCVIRKWRPRLIHVILLTYASHRASNYDHNVDLSKGGVGGEMAARTSATPGSIWAAQKERSSQPNGLTRVKGQR